MIHAALALCLSICIVVLSGFGGAQPAIASPQPPSVVYLASSGGTVFKFSGKRPTNLGAKEGKLADCPSSPNCVSSQSPDADTQHKIEPIAYTTTPEQAIAAIKSIVQGMDRTDIITETENYLYAEFTSALMGFVDDVEFLVDPTEQIIHVRSASRLGQSDLGVNRQRIEAIRTEFTA